MTETLSDADYYYKRAQAELEIAQGSEVPEPVRAHYILAGYYLDYVYGDSDEGKGPLANQLANNSVPEHF